MAVLTFHGLTTDTLTGRWETEPSDKGNVTSVLFKSNNNFEGDINKKPFVTLENSKCPRCVTQPSQRLT